MTREGVSNTITQLRFPGLCFFWNFTIGQKNRVKYVLPNISKLWRGFSLKLFVRTGWTFNFFFWNKQKGGYSMKFGTFGPSKLVASATSTTTTPTTPSVWKSGKLWQFNIHIFSANMSIKSTEQNNNAPYLRASPKVVFGETLRGIVCRCCYWRSGGGPRLCRWDA